MSNVEDFTPEELGEMNRILSNYRWENRDLLKVLPRPVFESAFAKVQRAYWQRQRAEPRPAEDR